MSWFSRLKNGFRPRRLDEDLAAELRDHIERRAADLRKGGLSATEAQRQASAVFGNLTAIREQSREIRMWAAIESVSQDLRYAWRGMRRSPMFTATAVLSLSLAIGAITAIYSIVDAAMLRPLPVPEPERLFTLAAPEAMLPGREGGGERDTFSYPLFSELSAAAGDAARLALFTPTYRSEVQSSDPNAPLDIAVEQFVSGEAFEILRVRPALGRMFSSEEDHGAGGHAVAILSYDYWQRRFHGDPAILGQTIRVGFPLRIVGVAAKGFFGIEPGKSVDVWVPATMFDPGAFGNREFHWAHIAGRLSANTTFPAIQSRLQPTFLADQKERAHSGSGAQGTDLRVRPGAIGVSGFRRTFARPLWIVMGVAAGILLIACSNVASLLLARASVRSPEMAVRMSLGAGRARLVRQLFTESLLLSALAGLGGWAIARVAGLALMGMLSQGTDPVRFALFTDARVLLLCAALCMLCGLLFGLLPAWQTAAAQPMPALRHASGRPGRIRMGRIFVGVQVAFAFCLVTGGAGFLFSLKHLVQIDSGFDPRGVTVLSISAGANLSLPQLQQVQDRIAGLSAVEGTSVAWYAIFEGRQRMDRIVPPGKRVSEREEMLYRIAPGHFAALRIPLLDGRDLTFQDTDAAQPIPTIVNLAFARRYFENESAIGKEFQREDGARHRIVGLGANTYYGDLRNGPQPIAYFPMKPTRRFSMYVRSPLDPGTVMRLVEREAASVAPRIRVVEATTLETLVGNTILREKLLAGIGGTFAALGLVLAAIGIFGLLNYSVTSRTKEISIRAALGARRGELVFLVLADLFGMIAGGLTAGLLGAVAFLSFVRSLLFGVRPADPVVIGTASVIFLAAALIAGGLPARRAATVDPMIALRQD
jgi:putative ABC transport system permease protein